MIGNRHATAGAYLALALFGLAAVTLLIAAAAADIDKAKRAELNDRKSAFAELERLEQERDRWRATATRLASHLDAERRPTGRPTPAEPVES